AGRGSPSAAPVRAATGAAAPAASRESLPGPWRLRHVLAQDLGELVEKLPGRELADERLLEERHALGVELAAPARVGEVRADDRERERLDEACDLLYPHELL